MGLANIVAPPLGALLLEIMKMQNILFIDVGTAILAITPLLFIPLPQPPTVLKKGGWRSVLSDMREGAMFVWNWKGLRVILMMVMVINLLVHPAFSLLPLMVTEHFGGGAIEFAWLESAMGVGMILGGIALGVWGGFKKRVVTAFTAVILAGAGIILLGLTPATLFFLAVGFAFEFAFMNALSNGTFFAFLQATIPPGMQGRVFTLLMSLSVGMVPVGLSVAGPIADFFGVRIWFIVSGISFLIMGVSAFFMPTVMNIESDKPKLA
jgi:DHA3 family macrolide efflux protein-like MFS transporter